MTAEIKKSRVFQNFFLILFGVFFGIIISEFGVRVAFNPVTTHQISTEVKLKGLKAGYFDAEEWYGKYDTMSGMQFYSKAGYRPIPNWSGNGVEINDVGIRSTVSAKEINYNSSVKIITGGSTAFGAGVKQDDLYTVGFNDVFTGGVGGYTFANEFSLMKDILYRNLNIDVWISLSGWNDVYWAYTGRDGFISPDMFSLENLISNNIENPYWKKNTSQMPATRKAPSYDNYKVKIHWLMDHGFYELSTRFSDFLSSETGKHEERVNEQKTMIGPISYETMWRQLADELILANTWAKLKGVRFIYVLQPDLYSTEKSLSPYEKRILDQRVKRYPNIKLFFSGAFTKLRSDIAILSKKEGFEFLDCDEFVQQKADTVTLFVDDVHFGSVGNLALHECISKAFYDNLN